MHFLHRIVLPILNTLILKLIKKHLYEIQNIAKCPVLNKSLSNLKYNIDIKKYSNFKFLKLLHTLATYRL